ncbi:MAG TPA: NAD(P)/FAD-dependent oxidoreductase [Burkholderiaceae bacterium]|nr:NAD(P)/FAD-dependent oxidoreductase [Burkholderiaceae bacterium]
MSNSTACDIVIIGGGPAGLSVASRLAKQSLKVIVIERSPVIGEVWANHYEGLRLNTVARLSRLGGKNFPSEAGQWPSKTDVVSQLQALAQASDAVFKLEESVEQLNYNATEKTWLITTNKASYRAPEVVLATGGNQQAVYPDWATEVSSHCRVLHSSQYYSAAPFAKQNVLVVGGGNSGAEIACRVAETANKVWLSLREAPLVLPKHVVGIGFTYLGLGLRHLPQGIQARLLRRIQRHSLGDHSEYGLPLPSIAYLSGRGKERAPTFYPDFLRSVREGQVAVRGGVQTVENGGVSVKTGIQSDDVEVLQADSIIFATGFNPQPGIEIIHDGVDISSEIISQACQGRLDPLPGLQVLGFVSPISGQFREINKQSKRIAKVLKRRLAKHVAYKALSKPQQKSRPIAS